MNNRLLVLAALAIIVAAFLVYQAGPAETIIVPSSQAEGGVRGDTASPAAWPERMTVDVTLSVPFRFDADGNLLIAEEPWPTHTPRSTEIPTPLCPPDDPGYCEWPTPTREPKVATAIPTCSATPDPGRGCMWTRT